MYFKNKALLGKTVVTNIPELFQRRPDGQADEPNYSSIRESDAGYESLQVAAAAASSGGGNSNPSYGIDTPQVRDQVYETLRGVAGVTGGHYANATASLNRRTPTAPAKRNHTGTKSVVNPNMLCIDLAPLSYFLCLR